MPQRNIRDQVGSFVGVIVGVFVGALVTLMVIQVISATSVAKVEQQNQGAIYNSHTK
jgi:hypothetical protein